MLIDGRAKTFADERRAYGKYCYGTGHGRLISDFYECVSENRKFAIDGAEGAKVVKLILSAYESGGEKIEIAGTPGRIFAERTPRLLNARIKGKGVFT